MNPYVALIELPLPVSIAVVCLPLLAITVILAARTGRGALDSRANDNVSTAAIRLVGGAFIFVSAFSTAAMWQESGRVADSIDQEFGHASAFVNHLEAQGVPEAEPVIRDIRDYATIVEGGELIDARVDSTPNGPNAHLFSAVRGIVELDKAGKLDASDSKILLDSLAAMTEARNSRLSQPHPILPLPLFVLVTTLGVFTIIVAAAYPSGPDRRLKWLQSLTAFAVVASLLGTVLFLVNSDNGWLREHHLRPVQLFMEETAQTMAGVPAGR